MANLRSTTAAILVSLIAVLLYSRSGLLYIMYANAPSRLEHSNSLQDVRVRFPDVIRNCEDMVIDAEQGFALLSCDPGRDTWNTVMGTFLDPKAPAETGLYLYDYTSPTSQPYKINLLDFPKAPSDFHPIGIDYHPSSQTVFVVNHAESGSCVEMFKLFPSENAATHIRTVKHDTLLAAPNAVEALSETELLVTNDRYFRIRYKPILAKLETYLGVPGGSVVYIKLDSTSTIHAELLARVPFANGIVRLNETMLAVASPNMAAVYLYSMEHGSSMPKLTHQRTIRVPFHPDNLSVDGDGKLLITGHPHSPTLEHVSGNSARCNALGTEGKEGCDVKAQSWISEWSEGEGLRTLYVDTEFSTSTTAARDVARDLGFAVGLYERGLMTWTLS